MALRLSGGWWAYSVVLLRHSSADFFRDLMTEPSPVENQRFPVKILHFDLSHKTETGYPPGLQDHCFFFFCLLMILRFWR